VNNYTKEFLILYKKWNDNRLSTRVQEMIDKLGNEPYVEQSVGMEFLKLLSALKTSIDENEKAIENTLGALIEANGDYCQMLSEIRK